MCAVRFFVLAGGVQAEDRLRERRMKTHSKCTVCSQAHTMLERLQGNTSPWAVEERAKILRVLAEHEEASEKE